ncbi:hypothetical protein [Endozoicomonas arenosclerae]|uniref:hypothetical protein n=1 Tax=Endozoicomonas arenosclerae TaxID=1633495 RepID=UPI000780AD19|nr:hypothetical protein [Endozoicomonas arenosclerae]
MVQLRAGYPLTIAAYQNNLKASYPDQSLSHLLGFQSLASARLGILQRQLLELRYAFRAQLNAHLNLSYSGLTGCDHMMPSPYSTRTEADLYSWMHYCQRQNAQHEVLSVEGSSFSLHNKKMAKSDEQAITKAYETYLDHRQKLLEQTVKDMTHLRDEGKAHFVTDMKEKEDKVQVMTKAREAADKLVEDVGKSVLDQLINGESLCVVNFLPGKNNCTANISVEGTIFGEDTTYQGHKDFHIKCFGSKKNGALFDAVMKKASTDSARVWFSGNCDSDVMAFGFDHSKDTLFNPKQLKHKQAASLAKVRDHFQEDVSKTPYYLDRSEYVKYLTHEKKAANPFPNKQDSFTASKATQTLLALDKKRSDQLKEMESKLYVEMPEFVHSVDNFLVTHLRGKKSYQDVLHADWYRVGDHDKEKLNLDLFEYVFINYA